MAPTCPECLCKGAGTCGTCLCMAATVARESGVPAPRRRWRTRLARRWRAVS